MPMWFKMMWCLSIKQTIAYLYSPGLLRKQSFRWLLERLDRMIKDNRGRGQIQVGTQCLELVSSKILNILKLMFPISLINNQKRYRHLLKRISDANLSKETIFQKLQEA